MVWKALPDSRKEKIYQQAAEEFPHVVEETMEDIKENIDELLDIKKLAVDEIVKDPALLNEIFLRCGKEEFTFIERSGMYFGVLFGIVQMVVWAYYPQWWILPIGGLLVGWLTNKLALLLIFEPKKPIKLGFATFQGLFIKRQKEVAVSYSKLVAQEIITSDKIFMEIMTGASDKLTEIVAVHVKQAVDKTAGFNRSLIQLTSGTKKYEKIKSIAAKRFVEELPNSITYMFNYAEEALDIENTLREKMEGLSAEEFEGVMRPAYEQDEWKLILTGALLGGGAGFIQMLFLV